MTPCSCYLSSENVHIAHRWFLTSSLILQYCIIKRRLLTHAAVISTGNREWKARKASGCDSRQIQSHMELPPSQGQQPPLLPRPGGPQELLLLQGCPQGGIHRRQPLHAREFRDKRLP